MAEIDKNTEIIDPGVSDKPVTNVTAEADRHGGANVYFYHALEEHEGLVKKAEIVAHLHFTTLEHLGQFNDRITKAIYDATLGGDITALEFNEALNKVTRKIEPDEPKA